MRRVGQALDAVEGTLRSAGGRLARPGAMHAAVVVLVLVAVGLRMPLVVTANDVPAGHNDANIYFNYVYTGYLKGDVYPDGHRGSGWNLLLFGTLWLFGVEGGDWVDKFEEPDAATQHALRLAYALSAMMGACAVVAVWLLARQVLPPLATLGAMALVAFDPYLLSLSTSAMSEPPYTAVFVLSLACVLKARQHPAWLLGAGALMALAHMLRINGVVMLLMVLLFAFLLLRGAPRPGRASRWTSTGAWMAAAVAVFLLVSAPYLAWRADRLPGPFDYGTNQRFWADDLWTPGDAYWTHYTYEGGGPRETIGDYFAKHDLGDAVDRLYRSVQWQVFDLFGFGKWPGHEPEGGVWTGTPPDGSALTPLVVALSLVGLLVAARRRELWFLPLALAFTFATFAWIYPLVRSVRYFSPLIPLFAVVAMVGWLHLATLTRRPYTVGALLFGTWLLLYGARPLLAMPGGVLRVALMPDVRVLVSVVTLLWVALALAPAVGPAAARLRENALRWREKEPQAP
jgi:4-amino-4-deoxy-L-arabinose transferase-like glycosyltransferase